MFICIALFKINLKFLYLKIFLKEQKTLNQNIIELKQNF
jgi:hypothetical protein